VRCGILNLSRAEGRKLVENRLTVLSQPAFSCKLNIPPASQRRIAAVLQNLRNIAIILALAAAVDFLPGGGNAAAAVLTALTMCFLAAIAWLLYRVYHEQQLTLATLTDAKKAGLFGAVGGIALLTVAYDDFRSMTGGILLWIALVAGCLGVIFLIWRSATTYS
jgi:hypothetical protein